MKRPLLFLFLLLSGFLSAQNDTLNVLRTETEAVETLEPKTSVLTWSDRREPLLAGFLSYLAPGLGQIYNKQYEKALGIVAVMAFTGVLSYQLEMTGGDPTDGAYAVIGFSGAWLYSFFDAIASAKKINLDIERSLGRKTSLSLKPTIGFNRNLPLSGLGKPEPVLGLKLNVSL
jgi:hypothetical protein